MELVKGPSLDVVLKSVARVMRHHRRQQSWSQVNDSSVDPPESTIETEIDAQDETYADSSSSLGSGLDYFDNVARTMAEVADALDHAHQEGGHSPRHQAIELAARSGWASADQ